MKTHLRFLWCCLALICVAATARAQLTGAIAVPSTTYPTLAAVIDSLNNQGVGTGGVVVTLNANETAPVGGYRLGSTVLNASTSVNNKVTFQGTGKTLTAFTGTGSEDGIFYIRGTDWVEINALHLAEASGNTSSTTRMEWGYNLVKLNSAAPYDGCQYVLIKGCNISLEKTYSATIGIRAAHTLAGASSTLSTGSSTPASTNSYNRFEGNTITNVTRGISLIGIGGGAAAYDKANVIGGATAALGNTITAGGAGNTAYAFSTQNDSVITISNNKTFIGSGHSTSWYAYNPSTGVGDLTYTFNVMDINCSMTGGSIYGYYNSGSHRDPSSGSGAASTHNISNNTITGNNTAATSTSFYGFYMSSEYCASLAINSNQIRDIDLGNSNGSIYMIYNSSPTTPLLNLNDNRITNFEVRGTSAFIYGIYTYDYSAPAGTTNILRNVIRGLRYRYYLYPFYAFGSATSVNNIGVNRLNVRNNVVDSVDMSGATSGTTYFYNYLGYYGGDSSKIYDNLVSNITGSGGTSYITNYFGYYGYYAPNNYEVRRNRVENVRSTGTLYANQYMGYYATLADSNSVYKISNTGTTGYSYTYIGYYGASVVASNNSIRNINLNGSGSIYNYIGMYNDNSAYVVRNTVDSMSTQSGTLYGLYSYGYGHNRMIGNRISNLYTNSTSAALYGLWMVGGTGAEFTAYNNFVTDINFPSGYSNTAGSAIYLSTNLQYRLYHNTIRVNPGVTGGFTGIYYASTASLDLRNNIINVNVTPSGSTFTAALRRNTGTAGTPAANFLATSNGNIYYAPNATNSWLYAEGSSAAGMVNTFDMTSDPSFNTPCGRFKQFMAHDYGSFQENNLVAATTPSTYRPTGTSYAEKGAVPTVPVVAIPTDFDAAGRSAIADIGALEFVGANIDNAPPVITYNAVPVQSYCVSEPTVIATITDVTGVNTTTGSAPRLYYKKANNNTTDADVFGVANNNTGNGWKWVEAVTLPNNQYSFKFNYSLLRSAVVPGDTIKYFIIAQDNAAVPNTGYNLATFTTCPTTVSLGSGNGPLKNSPSPEARGFRVLNAPVFTVDAFPSAACISGSATLSVLPKPYGTNVQWQTASLTGAFSNITGATGDTYTTPVLSTTTRYRAVLSCDTTPLATTAIDTFVIANPSVISVAGTTHCGLQSTTLSATTSPFSIGKWYAASTGGTSLGAGTTYTTPQISTTTTYYVAAVTSNASIETVSPPKNNYSYTSGVGTLKFRFRNSATNFYSTTVYPWYATVGATVDIELQDQNGTPVPGYSIVTFSIPFAGNGNTPVVVNLPWRNIPAGDYNVVVTPGSGGSLYIQYPVTYPINSPSGGTSITGSEIPSWSSTPNYYHPYLFNCVVGADCESATRMPVIANVTTAPAIAVSSPDTPGVCVGSTANLNVSSPNPFYVYNWQPLGVTGTTISFTPTASANHVVTAIDPYTGCVAKDSIRINVNAQSAPPTITPNPANICGGRSVQLTAAMPAGLLGVGSLGTGTSSTTSYMPLYTYYPRGRAQYVVTRAELNGMGITGPVNLTSWAFNVTSVGSRADNFTIRIYHAGTTTIIPAITCSWPGVNRVVYNAPTYQPVSGWNTFNFQTPFPWNGTDNIVIEATYDNDITCATTVYGNASTSIQYHTVPYGAGISTLTGDCSSTFCAPSYSYQTSMRPNMRVGYGPPAVINWLPVTGLYRTNTLATGLTAQDTISRPFASPATTTVYRAIVNIQGCKSLPSAPDTVYVTPAPNVTITPAGPQTICAGQTVTLCVPPATNQTYQWFLNNTAIPSGTANCFTATAAGTYKITVTNIVTGCAATSVNIPVSVNPAPSVTVTQKGGSVVCKGVSDTLTATGAGLVAFQWKESGVNIPGATNASYIVTASGTYTVEVTNSNGCVATSAATTITVNVTPTTITPQGPTTFCTGGNVTLQAPTAPAGATFTYQWRVGGANIAGATGSSYTASATGSYTVLVTNTTTGCRDSSAATVVNVGPPPSTTIAPAGTAAFCQGGNVTLSVTSQPGLCYQWNLNGAPIAGATNATYNANATGNYTVTVTICATPTCGATSATPTVVSVNPLPATTITPAGATSFCQGQSVVLNAPTGTGYTYQWNMNGSPMLGQTGASLTATATGTYDVTVTNSGTGCSATSGTVNVTVSPAPNTAVTSATPTTFCQGGNVNLCVPAGATGYAWLLNNTVIPGATANCYTANATGVYTVRVTGGNNCVATSIPTAVQVNALPDVTTIPSGTAAVCQGYSINLSTVADTNFTYQWMLNNVNISGAAATNAVYPTGAAGTYKVRVTNKVTGCVNTSADIVVVVNTPPTATASTTGASTICQGDSIRITANTGSNFSYQWRRNGVNIAGATRSDFYATQSGSYTVSISNATNCSNVSNAIVLTVNPRPASFITYNTPLEFCEGSAVVLTANSGQNLTYEWLLNGVADGNTGIYNEVKKSGRYSLRVTNNFPCSTTSDTLDITVRPAPVPAVVRNGTSLETAIPYVSYQWFFNNDPIGGATSQSYSYTQNGAYKVRVIDIYGCEGYSNLFFVNNVGIPTTAVGKAIRIFPNPTTGIVNIESSVKVKAALRDVAGKLILEASDVKQINLGDVANGMYMLYISDMNGTLLRADKVTKTSH